MTFCFQRGPLRCEGEKAPILQSLIDVAETPKDIFDVAGRMISVTAVIINHKIEYYPFKNLVTS